MSRKHISVSSREIEALSAIVREVVAAYRATGLKAEHARAQAAPDLGISERRCTAFIYGEIFTVCPAEAARIRAGFLSHLEREAARLTLRAAQATARRDALAPPATENLGVLKFPRRG